MEKADRNGSRTPLFSNNKFSFSSYKAKFFIWLCYKIKDKNLQNLPKISAQIERETFHQKQVEQAFLRVHRIEAHKISGLELEVKATDFLPTPIDYSEIGNVNSWLIYQFYKHQRKQGWKERTQTYFVEVCKPNIRKANCEHLTLLLQLPPMVYLALRWSWSYCTMKPKKRWEPENDPEKRWTRQAHMALDFSEAWNWHGPLYQ